MAGAAGAASGLLAGLVGLVAPLGAVVAISFYALGCWLRVAAST